MTIACIVVVVIMVVSWWYREIVCLLRAHVVN